MRVEGSYRRVVAKTREESAVQFSAATFSGTPSSSGKQEPRRLGKPGGSS